MSGTAVKICCTLLLACLVSACSNSRRLSGSERLYTGSKVRFIDKEASSKEHKTLTKDLSGMVRPRPNTKKLGMRLPLTVYNMAGQTKKKKGLRQWLRNKIGEPPVLVSSVQLGQQKELMANFLENKGFFNARVAAHFDSAGRRKSIAIFEVTTGSQYLINQVFLQKDSTRILTDIAASFSETLLKPGGGYNLDVIKAERSRIDRMLKEKGYFYFNPDYIIVLADSAIGGHRLNMYVKLKHREIPPEAYTRYTINDIFIFPNHKLRGREEDTSTADKVADGRYYIIDKQETFKPAVFDRVMTFNKGDAYSLDAQNTSLSRIMNLGNFKFVKNSFESTNDSMLDVYYYLTPYPVKSLRFEAGANTQNDNRAGTKGSISWKHRNAFRGAEEFVFKINGGFEAQYSGPVKQPAIYNFGAETNLSFPRFVVPFISFYTPSQYLPRSTIKLRYNFESSAKLINISSYTAAYGYNWREGPRKEHQFYPFNFTYVNTDTVGSPEKLGLSYGNLVFNGIIIGPTYEFTYNSQIGPPRRHSFYFNGRIDLSGNVLGVVQKANYETNPQQLFGAHYAQYVKLQPDFRHYLRLSEAGVLASRIVLGVGIPNGNSSAMPNIKQFWAGGNSDLRGFPSRLVGPGTFNEYDSANSRRYIQTLGDMKLEVNFELRQRIYKFINAGLFAEAGNVWQYHSDPSFPGGKFTSNFYKELAADLGAGLRFDFSILILRLDMGIPVRKPWLPEGSRWVIDKIAFADQAWKKNNMIFNIAIGYPF
jgi:outer membrane protein insertion porin family